MIDKTLYNLLEQNEKSQINDDEINHHIKTFNIKDYLDINMQDIKNVMATSILKMPNNKLLGYKDFNHIEFCIGVTQFIDNLIMKHGLDNIQILEHDYSYYKRLNQNLKFAQIGKLVPNKILLMSMPFAGHCDVHYQMQEILAECTEKNIDVHLDCAWLTCADDITFDFNHHCIKSFASSLSKCYTLGWNRIGIRWSRKIDETDSITIYNKFNMYNKSLCMIGYHLLKKFPINYYWGKYRDCYKQGCRKTYTFPTKIIWLAKDLNGNLFGTSKLVKHLYHKGMAHKTLL